MTTPEKFLPQEEQQLLLSAIHAPNDENKWRELFAYINAALATTVLHGTIQQDNETNIRQVVRYILKHKWHEGKWEKERIFSEEFFEICNIPICLPATFLGFLSGEFILYLLHPKEMEFYYEESINIHNDEYIQLSSKEGEEESFNSKDFEKDKSKMIYQRKYQCYYSAKSAYIVQFENILGISLKNIGKPKSDDYKNHQRMNNTLWSLFELYSYISNKYPDSEEENNSRIFTILKRPSVDLFHKGYMNNMNDAEKKLLLFLTILYQRMDINDRTSLSLRQQHIYINYILSEHIPHDFSTWMIGLFQQAYDPAYRNVQDVARTAFIRACEQWTEKLNAIQKELENQMDDDFGDRNFREKISFSEDKLYATIMWRILSIMWINEIKAKQAVVGISKSSFCNNVKFLSRQILSAVTIDVKSETDFLNKYSYIIQDLFPKKTNEELFDMLKIAVKVIVYCNHKRFGFNYYKFKTKKLHEWKWYFGKHIHVNEIQLNELVSCMEFLEYATKITVVKSGKKTKRFLHFRKMILHGMIIYQGIQRKTVYIAL